MKLEEAIGKIGPLDQAAMEIAQKYRVMSIPTFIAFKNGEEAGRQIGAVSKGELLSLIK